MIKKINRYSLLLLLGLFLSAFFVLGAKSDIFAACSGVIRCGNHIFIVCTDSSGNSCNQGDPGCNCVDSCGGFQNAADCSGYSTLTCNANAICEVYVGICRVSGSCSGSVTTPPPPVCNNNGICEGGLGENSTNCADCLAVTWCGDGICNGGETTATCSIDCPPGSTPAPTPAPTAPPVEGACGSCSGCYAPNPDPYPNACAVLNGVCSKAGYCGGGGVANPQCWIDGLYSPATGDLAVCGTNTGAFHSTLVHVPVGTSTRFCVKARGRSGEPAGFSVNAGTSYSTWRAYWPNSTSPIFYLGGYAQRFKGGARPYYVTVRGDSPGTGPFYMESPDSWNYSSGFPDNGNNARCDRVMNAVVDAGNMVLSPRPVNVGVGVPAILYADVTPLPGETVNSVTFTSLDVTVANASSPGVGPNPYTSQIVGLKPGAFTTVLATADTTAGKITRSVRVNVAANNPPTVTVGVSNATPSVGQTIAINANATDSDGTISKVDFYVDGALVGTDSVGPEPTYTTTWVVNSQGSHDCYAIATDNQGATTESAHVTINATFALSWFQIIGGGIVTNGSINSPIPDTCATTPGCLDFLVVNDPISNKPSMVVFGGSADFSANTGNTGNVSSTNEWPVNAATTSGVYTYDYFYALAKDKLAVGSPVVGTLTNADVNGTPQPGETYNWLYAPGSITIANNLNINKKTVLFVQGDLNINNDITLNDIKNDFFMAIVKGNINVDPALVAPDPSTPVVTGLYCADGSFSTGTTGTKNDGILTVLGSVAAGNINLERDLGAGNVGTPAESFTFSPDLVVNYPTSLGTKHLIWKEVNP